MTTSQSSSPKYLQEDLSEERKKFLSTLPKEKGWMESTIYNYQDSSMKKLEDDDFVAKKNEKVNMTFDGKSFGGWKRGMLIALTAKNKSGFIDGSTHELVVGTNLHNAWSRANNMVIFWLLNSLSREISESVLYSSTAKELWAELEARFGQSSGAKLFQLQMELSDLVQGSYDIATYYTKIKRLWDELDA
ncbi:hypothetical protein KY285_025467 [Solanum tuberosum]|nr:hypothetical protein KY289_023969 [Solanum tuberosum]KAH0677666.1 hypothetical protein KY285_025467 [Solanum tuberosum]